ncbi:MAG: tetratricopeptide repeat protein, partial [Wenzhouxiangellaceae bacterium]
MDDLRSGGFAILACLVFGGPAPVDADSDTADSLSARIDHIETVHTRAPWPVSQGMIDDLRPALKNAGVEQRARVDLMEARNLTLAGEPEQALDVLESILVQPVSLKNRARALELSAHASIILQNYARAFEMLSAALDLMVKIDDPGYRANLLALAARMHDGAGEPAMALKYAAESLELARKDDSVRVLCGAWWTLVRMQESAGLLDFALRGSDDLWAICQQSGDP